MKKLRFVHLSDIHFGQEKNGNLIFHEDVREQLIYDCGQIRQRLGEADGVLVTGDIAYSGKAEQYARAGEWLDRLTTAVGCDKTAVRTVPGNHDVDISEINHFADIAYKDIRGQDPNRSEDELSKCLEGSEEGNPLWPQQKAYREFAERYGCGFESLEKSCWVRDYPLEPFPLRLVGLNSAQISKRGDQLGQLILAKSQYIIERPENFVQVVMFHHPLDWLKNKLRVSQYITNRAQVLMFGHEHRANIDKVVAENDHEWLMLWAGATNPNEPEANYTYNWLEFSVRQVENRHGLVLKVYPQVWKAAETKFVRDRNRLGGLEEKELFLICSNLKSGSVPDSAFTGSAPMDNHQVSPQASVPMPVNEDKRFSRLRYFFWGFLDWRDRLTILVNLNVLPKVPEKQIPQTMERVALDLAKEKKKLAHLWDAVMKRVPEEKREGNPFNLGQE